MLLLNGACVEMRDREGNNALHVKFRYFCLPILIIYHTILIETNFLSYLLKQCCKYNQIELFRNLVQNHNADLNDRNPETLWTILHTAAYYNSLDIVYVKQKQLKLTLIDQIIKYFCSKYSLISR